jgi:hypothetical protein
VILRRKDEPKAVAYKSGGDASSSPMSLSDYDMPVYNPNASVSYHTDNSTHVPASYWPAIMQR